MAKVVFKSTPKMAYEYADVDGGGSMSDAQKAALLDEFVEEHGLVPVETTFVGETPLHRYGRYKAAFSVASAHPVALPGRENDLTKANADLVAANAQIARLTAQLGKKASSTGDDLPNVTEGASSANTSEGELEAMEAAGMDYVSSSEDVREDMGTNDKSSDNPVRRGRPPKAA